MTIVHANLDCEARWSGVVLPATVQRRISAAAVLLAALPDARLDDSDAAALAPMPAHDLYAPAAVDPARSLALEGWTPPTMHVGTPPAGAPTLAWADTGAAARAANDRRLAHAVAVELGVALPGAAVIESVDALVAHLAAGGAAAGPDGRDGRWVCKAVLTAAGRDRWHGRGITLADDARTRIARLIDRAGAVMFEPWLERVHDLGVCATVRDGVVASAPPHALRCDVRGGFAGIELASPPLTDDDRARLARAVTAAGHAIARAGYAGPFAIDAFVYRDARGATHLHPLCEINARYSFGWVARGLARRLGARALGFDAPPSHARLLVAATADDPTIAWIA